MPLLVYKVHVLTYSVGDLKYANFLGFELNRPYFWVYMQKWFMVSPVDLVIAGILL